MDAKTEAATIAEPDAQLTCRFTTKLGDDFRVPEHPVSIPANVTRYALSQIVNAMLGLDQPKPFDFLVGEELVRMPLHKVLLKNNISAESILTIEYMPAVVPPKSKQQIPHDDWVMAVARGAGNLAISGCGDGLVRTWATEDWKEGEATCSGAFLAHHGGVSAVSRTKAPKSGVPLLVTAGKDGVVRMWKGEDKGWTDLVATYSGHVDSVEGVAVSPDGRRLASCGWDGTVKLWRAGDVVLANAIEAEAGEKVKAGKKRRAEGGGATTTAVAEGGVAEEPWSNLEGHSQCVTGVAWDGSQRLVSGSWDHSVRIWDVSSGANADTLNAPKAINCVTVAGNNIVVFGGSDRVLRVWDPRGKGESLNIRGFASHNGWIKSVSACPETEHHVISGSYDNTVKLWDLRTSIPLATLVGHTEKVLCTAWASRSRILSGGADCSLRIHDMDL